MNEPEGAFIWLLPGAAERRNRFVSRSLAMVEGTTSEILSEVSKVLAHRGVDDTDLRLLDYVASGTDAHMQAYRQVVSQLLTLPTIIER